MANNYNTLYLIGIILSFIVGLSGVWIGIRNSKKTIFINSITAARIQYIQDLRNYVSKFCGLMLTYITEYKKVDNKESSIKNKELNELKQEVDNLKYLIHLHLNIQDEYFDRIILKLINDINDKSDIDPEEQIKSRIDELIVIMQFLLKLEWEGAKLESMKGAVSKRKKQLLYNKYVKRHEKHIEDARKTE